MNLGLRAAAAVIPAAGGGQRMGGVRKQYLQLAGEPLLLHALRPFLAHPAVIQVVVALPADDLVAPPSWLADLGDRLRLVAGGAERGDSVRNGLAALGGNVDTVLVHDAARPLVSRTLVDGVLAAVAPGRGAVPGLTPVDTIKHVDAEGRVLATLDRRTLRGVQTPQGFPRTMIVEAYRRAAEDGVSATDCAALVERYGGEVVVVPGSADNLKVTTPADVVLAEALLAARQSGGAG